VFAPRAHRYVAARKKLSIPTARAISPILTIPIVRAAAVDALGKYNGSVVAVEADHRPHSRCPSIRKMAYSAGADFRAPPSSQPSLLPRSKKNVITRDTMLKVGRRKYMNLTEAMAHSNNVFFETARPAHGF